MKIPTQLQSHKNCPFLNHKTITGPNFEKKPPQYQASVILQNSTTRWNPSSTCTIHIHLYIPFLPEPSTHWNATTPFPIATHALALDLLAKGLASTPLKMVLPPILKILFKLFKIIQYYQYNNLHLSLHIFSLICLLFGALIRIIWGKIVKR